MLDGNDAGSTIVGAISPLSGACSITVASLRPVADVSLAFLSAALSRVIIVG